MREIKFRAWDKNGDGMCYDIQDGIEFEDNSNYGFDQFLNPLPDDIHDWVVMQYIGIKDKNGVEIYEGDILKDMGDRRVVVEYNEGSFVVTGDTKFRQDYNFISEKNYFEVIGDTYQNPELLKEV